MNCLLVFDHLNDIIYSKYNKDFIQHINEFAVSQNLQEESPDDWIDPNVIVQIFSPIITSHRIMSCQFGNSYTSVQCLDGLKLHFDQYMGYLFVAIGTESDSSLIKRYLSICITLVRYLCGPDVYQLKKQEELADLTSKLIDSWAHLFKTDQAVIVEAVEQLIVNSDLSMSTLKFLQESIEKLIVQLDCPKIHALVLVQNKFLALYSSQNAKELSSTDILFCTILCYSTFGRGICENNEVQSQTESFSYKVLLAGPESQPKCLPHAVHIIPITEGVHLIYLLELGNAAIASSLYETFCHLHTLQLLQSQREKAILQPAFENLEVATKRLNDSMKKSKNAYIETSNKQIMKKWDVIKKKYQEFFKNGSDEALLRAETLTLAFVENLNDLLKLTSIDTNILENNKKYVLSAGEIVQNGLKTFNEFFKAKSIKNFSLGSSDSLTINKYLEEFPGLIHFLYIDRNNHRLTCPTLDFNNEENVTTRKVSFMINFARNHLMQGTMSIIWKDTMFSYAYFVWFEDNSGSPLKPTVLPTTALPLPGILVEDFYHKLKEVCFPKIAPSKIKCYELFCVHLGLVTASCVLEQTRRLSATIWDIKGHPSHPIDLL